MAMFWSAADSPALHRGGQLSSEEERIAAIFSFNSFILMKAV
jgi:hypothetical protein